jgi:alcohol dehydrogenase
VKTRAAVLREVGRPAPYAESLPLVIEDLELGAPGPGEVLIRIGAAGLCHSDLSVIDGNRVRPVPMALGHEAAAEVLELGEGAEDLRVGDHVVATFVPSCGGCEPCRHARPALCEPAAAANGAGHLLGGAHRLRDANGFVHHHLGVSAFAEHAVVSRRSLVRIDRDLPFEQAALFGCAVITGVGAVMNTAAMPRGASAAIVGLGGVGLAALLAARMQGADPLIAIDPQPQKRALALALGATHAYDISAETSAADIKAATRGGVEYAFEMAGVAAALELAYAITRRGGTTVSAGLSHPERKVSFTHLSLVAEERTLKGSYLGSCVPSRDVPLYVQWFREGRLPVDQLLGERVPFETSAINAAFDRLAKGEALRTVIGFGAGR